MWSSRSMGLGWTEFEVSLCHQLWIYFFISLNFEERYFTQFLWVEDGNMFFFDFEYRILPVGYVIKRQARWRRNVCNSMIYRKLSVHWFKSLVRKLWKPDVLTIWKKWRSDSLSLISRSIDIPKPRDFMDFWPSESDQSSSAATSPKRRAVPVPAEEAESEVAGCSKECGQRYSTLCEQFHHEKLNKIQLKADCQKTVETVRNFWKDKLVGQSTRAGTLVAKGLTKKCQE